MSSLLSFRAERIGDKCPFGNDVVEFTLCQGGCVWIQGSSGRGKTTLSMFLAGLSSSSSSSSSSFSSSLTQRRTPLQILDIRASAVWHDNNNQNSNKKPKQTSVRSDDKTQSPMTTSVSCNSSSDETCGVLFQQTTLLDELTVAGNLCIALDHCEDFEGSVIEKERRIKQLLDLVGLDYERDANKRVSQLSGGMSRRASLAVQLAQRKRIIVLDEPFTGLDHDTAISIAKELVHIRNTIGTAFILITHQYDIASVLMDETTTKNNVIVHLDPPPDKTITNKTVEGSSSSRIKPSLFGTTLLDRFLERLLDYIGYSMPLILLTFTATGLAISMLSADSLRRIDVSKQVLEIVDKEIRPMIKMLTGEEPGVLTMLGVRMKVNSMLNETIPPAKATLYAIGFAKLMVLEVGPLLTALLLTGRIGGSYAGKIATMHATQQMLLLQTLGIRPAVWTFVPSFVAAIIAAPVLTVAGTALSITLGGIVAPRYRIGTLTEYWNTVRQTTFPDLRIQKPRSFAWITDTRLLYENWIEFVTWPLSFHIIKAITFMTITIMVAELSCFIGVHQRHGKLNIRDVPTVITSSVVIAGLLIICADWAFSQLWLQRK